MYTSSSARRLVAIQLTPQALTLVEQGTAPFVLPNVRAEAGPTAKRQARAVENAPARRAGLVF